MGTVQCPRCKEEYPVENKFCPICGTPLFHDNDDLELKELYRHSVKYMIWLQVFAYGGQLIYLTLYHNLESSAYLIAIAMIILSIVMAIIYLLKITKHKYSKLFYLKSQARKYLRIYFAGTVLHHIGLSIFIMYQNLISISLFELFIYGMLFVSGFIMIYSSIYNLNKYHNITSSNL